VQFKFLNKWGKFILFLAQILYFLLLCISKYAEVPSNFQFLSNFNFGVWLWDIMFRSAWGFWSRISL